MHAITFHGAILFTFLSNGFLNSKNVIAPRAFNIHYPASAVAVTTKVATKFAPLFYFARQGLKFFFAILASNCNPPLFVFARRKLRLLPPALKGAKLLPVLKFVARGLVRLVAPIAD